MDEIESRVHARRVAHLPVYHYLALAVLFLVAASYQGRIARDIFRQLRHSGITYNPPFSLKDGSAIIEKAKPAAELAGIRSGDLLVAVDGTPYTGAHVGADVFSRAQQSPTLSVNVRAPQAGGPERTLQVPLIPPTHLGRSGRVFSFTLVILYVVMPFFCLFLGFWVAVVRPRDALAWLLLALLLGFDHILGSSPEGWGPGVRDFATLYHLLANNTWPIWMVLFGLYFPEPFPEGRFRDRFAPWLKWGLIIPLAILGALDIVAGTIQVESLAAAAPFYRLLNPVNNFATALAFVAVGSFFTSISAKAGMAVSRDARRRLRLLYWGATIGMTPIFVLTIIGLIRGRDFETLVPFWALITALLLMFLFPITLAYTIVVQRAMNVRVVVRQGLQYALARSGVRALQFILMVVVVVAATLLASDPRMRLPQKLESVAFGMAAVLWLKRGADRLRIWTDRQFFRDAYNAEQILSELGDKVRTIVETKPLLATVSHRIAESLHVPRVAVLLDGSGPYRPAYALGYSGFPNVIFPESAATVRQLVEAGVPTRVYRDDPDSWIYRRPGVSDEERRQLAELDTELLLPLATKKHLLGFISLGQKRSEEPYTSSDLRLLNSVAIQTGLALENSRLTATVALEVAEREKLNREVEIAREVQQRLFPQKLPPVAGLDYSGACRPALGVGGDYYDFLALSEGRLGIALGDVSGKGIAAALMMATLQASLRGEATHGSNDLGQMIAGVNRLVFDASTSNRYATFFYAQYDPAGRTLSYVNAGHNPPMLFRWNGDGGEIHRLDVGGTVIGLMESFPFQQATVALKPRDLLVLYTDGVSEAMNPADDEWGEAGMMEAVERCRNLRAAQIIEYVMAAADTFASGAPQHDDMTLVVIRVLTGDK